MYKVNPMQGYHERLHSNGYVYVLKLDKKRYYVGSTVNLIRRINQHMSDKGSKFIKKYKPVEVLEVVSMIDVDGKTMVEFEDNKATEYIRRYGSKKVRGGGYTHPDWVNIEQRYRRMVA